MSASETIKLFPYPDVEFTAEDLLHVSSPFGCVVSVQKIGGCGHAWGLVTYSDATDALMATMELIDNKTFTVGRQAPKKERKVQDKGSESPCSKPEFFHEDDFNSMPPWRHHRPHRLYPPAYSQPEYLRICNLPRDFHQRHKVLGLLPLSSTIVEMTRDTVLVMLPDFDIAMMLKKFLCDFYTGSRRLSVYYENFDGRFYPPMRTAPRRSHQNHRFQF